jgi:hypothetical protein
LSTEIDSWQDRPVHDPHPAGSGPQEAKRSLLRRRFVPMMVERPGIRRLFSELQERKAGVKQ